MTTQPPSPEAVEAAMKLVNGERPSVFDFVVFEYAARILAAEVGRLRQLEKQKEAHELIESLSMKEQIRTLRHEVERLRSDLEESKKLHAQVISEFAADGEELLRLRLEVEQLQAENNALKEALPWCFAKEEQQ